MKVYGWTYLTIPVKFTINKEKAEKSVFQYNSFEHISGTLCFSLSRLGIINGFLSLVGLVLVCDVIDQNEWKVIKSYKLIKKWW